MNRIRKCLIHLLGGVTRDELQRDIAYYFKSARVDEIQQFKWKMEACYGMPAGEWRKNVYEYTCKRYEAIFKDFKEYVHSINY